jgi:uncharacterized damage-inducible protein DinB
MIWTAPTITRPGGSFAAAEDEMLRGLLEWHRSTLLFKCAGLTAEQLAMRPLAQTNLSLQGLIRHLAKVERTWFRRRFAAQDIPALYSTAERPDADFEDLDPAHAEAEYQQLLDESQAAREIAAGVPMNTTYVDGNGDEVSLRFLHIHMIGEYARHNGHADMLRQAIDGVSGA